jgi:hypothetical protein
VSAPGNDTTESRIAEYAREFIRGYTKTIDEYFSDVKTVIFRSGRGREYLPLYGRQLGVDIAIAVFYTQIDFYLFFLDKKNTEIETIRSEVANDLSGFGWEWTSYAPARRRIQRVRELLGLEESEVLQLAPSVAAANIPGTNFVARGIADMGHEGYRHGVNFGNQAGERAESALPMVQEMLRRTGAPRPPVYQLFVIMPFGAAWSDGIYAFIRRAVARLDAPAERIHLYRADDIVSPGQISVQIKEAIESADVVIADITGVNPNVMWELGYADGREKQIVILNQTPSASPFDIADRRQVAYRTTPTDADEANLVQHLAAALRPPNPG